MKKTFEEKMLLVKNAIVKQLQVENVVANDNEITNISIAYMLVEQTLWFRLDDEKKIETLLTKFEDLTGIALTLLEKYHFEDLVYTFRKNFTNLFEVQGIGRQYNLSKKDYEKFINGVQDGSIVVLQKPRKVRKSLAKKNNEVVQPTKFLGSLVSKAPKDIIQIKKDTPKIEETPTPQPKVEKAPKKTKETTQPKVVTTKFLANLLNASQPKVEATKKGWTEHDKKSYLQEKTFLKVKLIDKSNVFGRFEKVESSGATINLLVDVRGTIVSIDVANIDKVYTYQR